MPRPRSRELHRGRLRFRRVWQRGDYLPGFPLDSESSQGRRTSRGFSSNLYGRKGRMYSSSVRRGANVDVVVTIPFDTFPAPVMTPSIARTSSAVTTLPGLYALT